MAEWKMLFLSSVLLLWPQIFSTTYQGCLITTNTKVLLKNLDSYTIQHKPLFSVNAVRFRTIKGLSICSDPSSPWAIKAMKYLDAKKKPQSASGTAPQSVTAAPKKMSTINTKSAQSSTNQIYIRGHTKQKTECETKVPIPRTKLEPDWTEGSAETSNTFELDGLGWEKGKGDVVMGSGCLTTTNTKVLLKYLRSYTIQHKPLFPVNAVRFLTIKGNTICSDPSSPWAIKAVKHLDAKKKTHSTNQICSTPAKKQVSNYTQNITDIIGHTTQTKTGNDTAFSIPRTKVGQDWRGSNKTTETFQLDGQAWEEEESTIMNEPIVNNHFCLKGGQNSGS